MGFDRYLSLAVGTVGAAVAVGVNSAAGGEPCGHPGVVAHMGLHQVADYKGVGNAGSNDGTAACHGARRGGHVYLLVGEGMDYDALAPLVTVGGLDARIRSLGQGIGDELGVLAHGGLYGVFHDEGIHTGSQAHGAGAADVGGSRRADDEVLPVGDDTDAVIGGGFGIVAHAAYGLAAEVVGYYRACQLEAGLALRRKGCRSGYRAAVRPGLQKDAALLCSELRTLLPVGPALAYAHAGQGLLAEVLGEHCRTHCCAALAAGIEAQQGRKDLALVKGMDQDVALPGGEVHAGAGQGHGLGAVVKDRHGSRRPYGVLESPGG